MVSSFSGSIRKIDLPVSRSFISLAKKDLATIHSAHMSKSRTVNRPFVQRFDFSSSDPTAQNSLSQYDDEDADVALDDILKSSFAESENPDGYLNGESHLHVSRFF
jgi:hypothetical protein